MIIKNRKTRFKIKKFILNIFFYLYSFNPNRKLNKYFYYTKSDKYKNYSDLYNIVQALTNYKKFNKVLEIGIGGHDLEYQGGASLLALNYFFNKSKIYGLDLMNKEFLDTKRIKTFTASQNDKKELEKIGKKNGLFDIIIDDGSHFVDHQLTSFKALYKYLNNDGLYIIEDLSGSYKKSSNGDPNLSSKKNILEYFSKHVHSTNSEFLVNKVLKTKEYLDISKIFFFGRAVLIQKKFKKRQKPYSEKLAYQKLYTLNKNRKKIKLHDSKIRPIKMKTGLIKFTHKI
jgi:hypothetical protein